MSCSAVDVAETSNSGRFLTAAIGEYGCYSRHIMVGDFGGTYHHWRDHVMKLNVGGTAFTLRGDPSLHKTRVSFKATRKILQQE